MKFATAPLVALRSGTTFAHLVKYSIVTSIHMYPRNGGLTSPTKSSPQVWKGHGVTMLCKLCGWVWIRLTHTWQLWHFFTNSAVSFSWQANSNPFVAGICKAFSFPGAPHTFLSVLLLSILLLLQGPNTLRGPHRILFWKWQYYAKSNALPASWACIFCCASVAGCLLLSTVWMGYSVFADEHSVTFFSICCKLAGPTLGLDSVCIFTHA